jgi:hypothetical protein
MTHFRRYQAGDHVEVWADLIALGSSVRESAALSDARSVAWATMERVATNVERLIARLKGHGYEFGVYPDGTALRGTTSPLIRPNTASLLEIDELEHFAGTIPLSLRAFWEVLGCVCLIGRTCHGRLEYSDPLYVAPPIVGIVDVREFHPDKFEAREPLGEPFACPIAPDFLHKDNISGGEPYSIRLPNVGADTKLENEWHDLYFVNYLRVAILEWGGFPGLASSNPFEKWRAKGLSMAKPEWLPELTDDLLAF